MTLPPSTAPRGAAPAVPATLPPATVTPAPAPAAPSNPTTTAHPAGPSGSALTPIDRGRAGPGLLAQLLVSKYDDHLPLHRQERIFARYGLDLSRSTRCDPLGGARRSSMRRVRSWK